MIRSTHIAITLLLLVPHLTRAGSQQSATFGQEDYAQLEGVVRDAVTGVGIGGVSVQLFGTNSNSTTTDQEGRFAFEELKPGDVAMFATKSGYFHSGPSWLRAARSVTLEPGATRAVDVELSRGGVISGLVYTPKGRPFVGAQVTLWRVEADAGTVRLARETQLGGTRGETNDLGEFRLFWLQPGSYYLRVTVLEGVSPKVRGGAPGLLTAYYPGTVDPTRANPIDVVAGEETRVRTLTLVRQTIATVRGHVEFDPSAGDGGRLNNLLVRRRDNLHPEIESDSYAVPEPGAFELRDVVPGEYEIIARGENAEGPLVGYALVRAGFSDIDDLVVLMDRGIVLEGSVSVAGELAPPEGLRVVVSGLEHKSVALVEPGGAFEVAGLVPGAYRLGIEPLLAGFYVEDIRLGSQSALEGFELDRTPPALEVVLGNNGGTIVGSVATGGALENARYTVVLIPDRERRGIHEHYRSVTTDSDGRFEVSSIAPGDYRILTWDSVHSIPYLDVESMRPFEELGLAVSVAPESIQELYLSLATGP